jgi:hypothetical protein
MSDEPTGRHARKEPDDGSEVQMPAQAVPAPARHAAPSPTPTVALDPAGAPPDPGYTAGGVPTFESVRDKIENRYNTSVGSAELDAATPEGRSVEEQYEARQQAAAQRLEEIRAAMHAEHGSGEGATS